MKEGNKMKLPRVLSSYSGLPRGIYILFFVRIINSMGSFVFPLLTLFLTDKLGLGAKEAGMFVSLSALSYIPGGLLGGKLSDIIGRKKVMIIFQTIAALLFLPCAFLGNSMIIPWLLILAGVSISAVQPANSAMVADLTDSSNRKAAFSLLYLGINIGFSVGPILAAFLYRNYFSLTFIGNSVAILITLLLVIFFVDETKPNNLEEEEVSEEERAAVGSVFSILLKKPAVLAFALCSSVYSFAYSQGNFSTPLQLKELFGDRAAELMGGLYFTNGIMVVTMTTLIIYLTKKNKPLFNIAISGVFFAVGFGMNFFITVYPLFILTTIVWTIGEIVNATNMGVYIADHAPSSHRGRFNSVLNIITGAGSAIGPLIMGGYIENLGVKFVWPLVFSVTMISALMIYLLHLRENRQHKVDLKI
jgi:MFS family permease